MIPCIFFVNNRWRRVDKQTSYAFYKNKRNRQLNHKKLRKFSLIFGRLRKFLIILGRLRMYVELMSATNF